MNCGTALYICWGVLKRPPLTQFMLQDTWSLHMLCKCKAKLLVLLLMTILRNRGWVLYNGCAALRHPLMQFTWHDTRCNIVSAMQHMELRSCTRDSLDNRRPLLMLLLLMMTTICGIAVLNGWAASFHPLHNSHGIKWRHLLTEVKQIVEDCRKWSVRI